MLTGAFVVFVLPLLCAALGAVLGWQLGPWAGQTGDAPIVLGAVIFFLLSLAAVKAFDRRAARNQGLKPVIIEIIE